MEILNYHTFDLMDLLHCKFNTRLLTNNSYNLTAGTHIVDFYSTNYVIPQIRIDISGKSNRYRAFAMIPSTPANGIEGFGFVQTPITTEPIMHIKPIAPMEYFEKEEPFDPFSMLKNPMVITMIVGLGIAFLAPKLVDPETMKEAQATMSQSESELKNMFSAAVADKKKK
jgi:hypothetical protein